ncbi:MAG TPA: hypothetical protein VF916_01890 [Ktedonobacterales bacterium]
MYGFLAAVRRRCTATRRDGQPCRGWALWDMTRTDGRQLCLVHAGHIHRGPQRVWDEGVGLYVPRGWHRERTRYTPCTCAAYQWPHRPGGGLCRWPYPPEWRCTIPAGTHSDMRLRRGWATR